MGFTHGRVAFSQNKRLNVFLAPVDSHLPRMVNAFLIPELMRWKGYVCSCFTRNGIECHDFWRCVNVSREIIASGIFTSYPRYFTYRPESCDSY